MLLSLQHPGTASAAAELLFISIYVLTVLYIPSDAIALRLLSLSSLVGVTWALLDALAIFITVPQLRAAMLTVFGVQLLNASDIVCLLHVDSASISRLSAREPAAAAGQHGSHVSNGSTTKTKTTTPSDLPLKQSTGAGTAALAAKTFGLLWNLRRIGTPWEIKNLAPTRRESRARFLLRRGSVTLLAYFVLEFLFMQPPPDRALITPGKETLFDWRRLSMEDVIFRVAVTIGMGFNVSLLMLIMGNVSTIFLVAIGASRPEECPTLNGSVRDAYTVRKFWRSVWHQGLQRSASSHAHAVVNAVFPRSSLISNISRLLIAFYISGLLHYLTDLGLGIRGEESGAVSFFCLQALGITIEEAAQTVPGLPASVRRAIGYLWVVVFMSWSLPVWSYPQMRLGLDMSDTLPFRIASPLIRAWTSR